MYSRFRSLLLHEAIGLASIPTFVDDETGELIRMIATPLLDYLKPRKIVVRVELNKITDRFHNVARASAKAEKLTVTDASGLGSKVSELAKKSLQSYTSAQQCALLKRLKSTHVNHPFDSIGGQGGNNRRD